MRRMEIHNLWNNHILALKMAQVVLQTYFSSQFYFKDVETDAQ